MVVLGIDIGGSGIKGALVNSLTGEMLTERHRIPTPPSRKPKEMAKIVVELVKHFDHKGPVGVGFPTVIKHGICKSPGNLHKKWMNVNVSELFSEYTGLPVTVINDADAAGYAAMNYGIGKGKNGFVLMITIGTGLGSGAFLDGELIPNMELGQIPDKKTTKETALKNATLIAAIKSCTFPKTEEWIIGTKITIRLPKTMEIALMAPFRRLHLLAIKKVMPKTHSKAIG